MPAEPAPGAGVRVAVIDSGAHPQHPHILAEMIATGTSLVADETDPADTRDRIGHGTAVTAAIQEKAPGATIVPVRVFGTRLQTSARTLVDAIAWSVAAGADVVNLSLGTSNPDHRERFAPAVAAAVAAGVLIVAPRQVGAVVCLPGALDGALGVELDWECPRDRYRTAADVVLASGYPRPIEGVAPRRNLHGVSFATAQVSAFAAVLLAERPDLRRHPVAFRKAMLAAGGV